MTEEKPVWIRLHSEAYDEEGMEEPNDVVLRGSLTGSEKQWVLRYRENVSDDPDQVEMTDVLLVMEQGRVAMHRVGGYGVSMVFDRGRRFEGSYHTPYGDFPMSIYTTQTRCDAREDEGIIELAYELSIQGGDASCRRLRISYAAGDLPC